MINHLRPAAFLLLFNVLAYALSPQFIACQVQKPANMSPLLGCPAGTIFVSQNTSDTRAKFHSIQEAVLSLPDMGRFTILVAEGEYHETVNVTRKGPLTLLVRIRFSSSFETPNLVRVWNNQFVQTGMDDAQSAVLLVSPNFNGSLIGAGPTGAPLQPDFGCSDFKAYNIDFENRAANFSISQALVTDISYANASFYGCNFKSYQGTWYTGRNGSTYVVDSVIFGQTDCNDDSTNFTYYNSWFQNAILANRACRGGTSPDANATTITDGLCFLGRPWNDLATTVFLRTFIDNNIRPARWTPFNSASDIHSLQLICIQIYILERPVIFNTTFYAEFDSTGPGGNTSARIPLEHILTAEEAKNFTIDKVFLEHPKWIDFGYLI
ncbi:carbohydrate esterase family 8 protein [Crucibulum laeve]|uniref:pectinesterase n=1 Tax=Crucibulum laeve TaxID=68775 RepID=A0A5C3LMY7_9AGAR|nr:carbohydrate esterase family 8 protein [Crucibulum laeve]